ncbi:oxygenase MpaB family protein [Mycobacterium hubeiense]|uniref:oxygenase MpaB family protein n=1 Tax=Mycobacterium hubeiense TaxID=1867256 RepID=UPI000C7EDC37|nr:oxygenase MpaB family protein [Mycobacterium sp. QGD 101]
MNTSIPARHPDQPRPVPTAVRLFATVMGVGEPTPEQWRELGEQLTVGDEPMDRLVEWMSATGMEQTRPLFDRALTEGIANVPEAPEPLREFFQKVETVPDWVDWDQLRRGQRAMRRGGADGIYIARDVALLGGYQFSGFNKTLVRTGALEKGSNKRFAETMQWALDIIADGGMVPSGIGYQSTLRVRLIHAFVRRHVAAMPDWRGDEWGVPVNQTDMAATLVGALIAPPAGALGMGIVPARGDLDAIAHLTRYVGYLIGVRDEWLPRNFRDGIRVLYHTLTALSEPDESTKQLAMPMADDPLAWLYRTLPGLRRRLARAQHLSVASGFLGPRAMRSLGLPAYVPPWYPVLRLPVNVARSVAAIAVPGGMDRAAARGSREQKALLRTMIGDDDATIGQSAAHVSQVA